MIDTHAVLTSRGWFLGNDFMYRHPFKSGVSIEVLALRGTFMVWSIQPIDTYAGEISDLETYLDTH